MKEFIKVYKYTDLSLQFCSENHFKNKNENPFKYLTIK